MMTMRDGEGMGMEPFFFADRKQYGHTGGGTTSGAWLAYDPEEKLAVAYTTNAKIYPVKDIIKGVFDIYWGRSFEIPSFEVFRVEQEIIEKYLGTYVNKQNGRKMVIVKTGETIGIDNGPIPIPLEATSINAFMMSPVVSVTFDLSNKQMIIKRPQGEGVFVKEN